MRIKFFSMLIALIVVSNIYAQSNLNDYKYVIVPKKFEFLKLEDQYQLNSLAEFLFNKYGFKAFKEGTEYPEDLHLNRCLALSSQVTKGSGMFKSKLTVVLKDCNGSVVFTSKVGESREKEFKTAYNQALRRAFESFEDIDYAYVPNENNKFVTTSAQRKVQDNSKVEEEIKKLKEVIELLKEEKEAAVEEVVEVKEVKDSVEEVAIETVETVETKPIEEPTSDVLYAQEIGNGFQLVDNTPKVVYKIIKTGVTDVFLVEGKSAIIYKKGNTWSIEYSTGSTVVKETLNIKF